VADTFDLQHAEKLELVVPAPPEVVEPWLGEQVSALPGKATFKGTVGDGRFSLLRKGMGKRNLRPLLEGRVEAVPEGTRISATCALPSWSRLLGRGVGVWFALFGVFWLGWGALIAGVPDDPIYVAGALFLALVWLPFSGMMVSGSLVSQAVAERAATPAALQALVVAQWPDTEVDPGSAELVEEPVRPVAVQQGRQAE